MAPLIDSIVTKMSVLMISLLFCSYSLFFFSLSLPFAAASSESSTATSTATATTTTTTTTTTSTNPLTDFATSSAATRSATSRVPFAIHRLVKRIGNSDGNNSKSYYSTIRKDNERTTTGKRYLIGTSDNTNNGNDNDNDSTAIIGIANYRNTYDNDNIQEKLNPNKAHEFQFRRFQSPSSIQKALHIGKKTFSSSKKLDDDHDKRKRNKSIKMNSNKNNNSNSNNFTYFEGKDGRKGYVSSKKLGGDWVLAQSKQVAKDTTTKDVLQAYLNGSLHEQWNTKDVLECHFTCRDIIPSYDDDDDDDGGGGGHNEHETSLNSSSSSTSKQKMNILSNINKRRSISRLQLIKNNTINNSNHQHMNNQKTILGKYYQQDLVLRSQRIITSETGIMRYSQSITIDQVGKDNYCVIVRLENNTARTGTLECTNTKKKPFDSLLVHVGLEQNGNDVNIYADGIMEVNRKVVPNLLVFDASGIAGAMAGKGTLWIGAHFEEERWKKKKDGSGEEIIR